MKHCQLLQRDAELRHFSLALLPRAQIVISNGISWSLSASHRPSIQKRDLTSAQAERMAIRPTQSRHHQDAWEVCRFPGWRVCACHFRGAGATQADLKEEEKKEVLDGDAGVHKLFRDIYSGARPPPFTPPPPHTCTNPEARVCWRRLP